jgi:hypothetical protein
METSDVEKLCNACVEHFSDELVECPKCFRMLQYPEPVVAKSASAGEQPKDDLEGKTLDQLKALATVAGIKFKETISARKLAQRIREALEA